MRVIAQQSVHRVLVPLRRLGEPAEIDHAVRFIVESDFLIGRCLGIDGGLRV